MGCGTHSSVSPSDRIGSQRKLPHREVHGGHSKRSRLLGARRRRASHCGIAKGCGLPSFSGSSPQKRYIGESALWQSKLSCLCPDATAEKLAKVVFLHWRYRSAVQFFDGGHLVNACCGFNATHVACFLPGSTLQALPCLISCSHLLSGPSSRNLFAERRVCALAQRWLHECHLHAAPCRFSHCQHPCTYCMRPSVRSQFFGVVIRFFVVFVCLPHALKSAAWRLTCSKDGRISQRASCNNAATESRISPTCAPTFHGATHGPSAS